MNIRPTGAAPAVPVSTSPQAPAPEGAAEPRETVELGQAQDKPGLGLRLARTGAGVVGAITGGVLGAGVGAVKGAGADQPKVPDGLHRALRVAGAVTGLVAGVAAAVSAGPVAIVAGLVGGPLIGAIVGGAAGGALEGLVTAEKGAAKGILEGVRKGFDIGRTVVDKIAEEPKSDKPKTPPADPR